MRVKKDGMQVIYNTSKYQNIKSVLCGYHCLHFLHQWSMKNDFYYILKPFSHIDTNLMKGFITNYFKHI